MKLGDRTVTGILVDSACLQTPRMTLTAGTT